MRKMQCDICRNGGNTLILSSRENGEKIIIFCQQFI